MVRPARGRSGLTARTGNQAGTEVAVPADLAEALDRDLDARRALDAVSSRASSGWCCRSSTPRPPRRGGASPGRSRSCGRAAAD